MQMVPAGSLHRSAPRRRRCLQGRRRHGHGKLRLHTAPQDLVEKGEVSEKTIDGLVRNVLRLKYRLGLFDNPYVDLDDSARRFYTEANLDGARRAAEESAVLLTNNGILPLKENVRRIAVTGPLMDAKHDQNGTWCFDMEKEHTVTALEALTEMYGKDRITHSRPGSYPTAARPTHAAAYAVCSRRSRESRRDPILRPARKPFFR